MVSKSLNYMKYISVLICTIFLFLAVFGRTFSGLIIYNFRIGELIVVFGLSVFVMLFFYNLNIFYRKRDFSYIFLLQSLLVATFVIFLFPEIRNLINPYVYKASNYIWTLSYLYVGIYIKKYFDLNIYHILILNFSLLFSYFLSVLYYPQFLVDFFFINSDKFDFLKAHMHLLFLIIVSIINFQYLKNKQTNFYYFLLLSGLFLPLLIFKSRGAFLSFLLFFLFYLLINIKFIKKNIGRLLIVLAISSLLFVQSSIFVSDSDLTLGETDLVVSNLIDNKETLKTFFSFYTLDGRLYSDDGNINWRLQIWQDVFIESSEFNQIFFGSGFEEIISAMDTPSRTGADGFNENVHNYFINVFARGGLVHLLLILGVYICLLKNIKDTYSLLFAMAIVLPILTVSFFDASMENPHFPAIFYLFIGFIQKKDYYNKI